MSSRIQKSRSGQIDWLLLVCYLCLVGTGLLMIFTTTYNDQVDYIWSLRSSFGTQGMWAAISMIFIIVISILDWRIWNSLAMPSFVASLLLLAFILLFGTEINGAKSWLVIGSWSLQPGEFAKLGAILFSASLLSSVQINLKEIQAQLIMFALICAPAFLILLQPDPGTSITFFSLLIVYYRFNMPNIYYLAMTSVFLTIVFSLTQGFYVVACAACLLAVVFSSKFSRKDLLPVLILSTAVLANILCYQFDVLKYALILDVVYLLVHLFYMSSSGGRNSKFSLLGGISMLILISFGSSFAFENVLKPHQQDRINVWLQPEKCDPRGSLYNLQQSKLAIGSGGLSGKGYLNGTLTKFNYVPEQTTDFIFTSIGEEQGFLGSIGVVALFLIISLRLINIGENSNYNFVKAYCYGVAGFIFFHFFINIGMTMGISPVIGIPLPFVSKGGSALLSFSIMIGIALNMSKER